MKTTVAAIVLPIVLCAMTAVAGPVTVTNVTAAQRIGEPIVDIAYALLNPSGGLHTVAIEASTNSGMDYLLRCTNFSGAVGAGVTTGMHKQVVWFAASDLAAVITTHARVRVTATDMRADTNGMVLIPAGPFIMGNCMTNTEGYSDELPLHTVTVNAFYMDRCDVTYILWTSVYQWAVSNGYMFDNAGSGNAAKHPVQTVSWYDCVKWCNARSEMEGLTPCYYTNVAQTLVYLGGRRNLSNEWVKWMANGYRLPTEAEWEKAARGGTPGHRFPLSDVDFIDFNRANYWSYWSNGVPHFSYDHATTSDYHPSFATGSTSPVGYFAPNGYGLYDMAGNVWQWCWDWYRGTNYMSVPSSDPRGPSSGAYRVLRGGNWHGNADGCRVANPGGGTPGFTGNYVGFRCVRGL